tara:strand:- start:5463 stop:6221 length:759 start_codon:yes stop_codon:yes gene_type:complete
MKTSSLTEYAKRTFYEMMKDVATSIPGHVLAFDPETQLAQIQIGIVGVKLDKTTFIPSALIEVPVHFTGGDFSAEYQIDVGNEGFILFSQRCVDGWKNTGGVANNPILRFHDKSDAVFFPGIRSQPNVLSDFKNNGIRLRNKTGDHYVWLKNDGTIETTNDNFTQTINPDGSMTETNGSYTKTVATDGTVNINGFVINPDGSATSPVSMTAPTVIGSTSLVVAGKEVKEHKHDKGTYLDAESRPLTGDSGTL